MNVRCASIGKRRWSTVELVKIAKVRRGDWGVGTGRFIECVCTGQLVVRVKNVRMRLLNVRIDSVLWPLMWNNERTSGCDQLVWRWIGLLKTKPMLPYVFIRCIVQRHVLMERLTVRIEPAM